MGFTDLEHREYARVQGAMRAPEACFVFGSNEAGKHGKGAARQAWEEYGARWGVGEGLQGRSYALPTKDGRIRTLPLERIAEYVDSFVRFAHAAPELTFVVTRVGCGLAGYTDADMAPLFAAAPENCLLPIGWREIVESTRAAPEDVEYPAVLTFERLWGAGRDYEPDKSSLDLIQEMRDSWE